MVFEVGSKVAWVSSNVQKAGEVVAIVPAGQCPIDVGFPKAGGGGLSRDHETYVCKGHKLNSRGHTYGSPAVYWPMVSLLRRHEG